jgi:S-adenosyl methyltransferase
VLDEPYVLRTRDQISQFLADLELIEPGLVLIDEWRPDAGPPDVKKVPIYAAVGRTLATP